MKVGIFIFDQAEVLDFSGPFEVFSTAARLCEKDEPPFDVFLIAETAAAVTARAGFRVLPDYCFDDHPELDLLIVPGGVHTGEMEKPRVIDWIAGQGRRAGLVASVCTGAFLLAQAGLVRDQAVTTHWEDIPDLKARYPGLDVIAGVRWVDQGKRVTSAGISAGIDMSLHLVSRLHSQALAERTAHQMMFSWTGNP